MNVGFEFLYEYARLGTLLISYFTRMKEFSKPAHKAQALFSSLDNYPTFDRPYCLARNFLAF
jgi:hypothetical protein